MTATSTKLQKPRSPARKDTLMRRIQADIGNELPTALQHSSDPRAERLLEMLLDPAYSRHSLAKLCERVGLKSRDLLELFRHYQWDLGILAASRHLPEIMEGLSMAASPSTEVCSRCDGLREVEHAYENAVMRTCPVCKGTGTVWVPGDDRAARLLLEVTGHLGRQQQAAVRVTVGQQFDLAAEIRRVDRIIEPNQGG